MRALQLNMGQEEFNLLGISAGLGTLNLAVGSSAFILTPKTMKGTTSSVVLERQGSYSFWGEY